MTKLSYKTKSEIIIRQQINTQQTSNKWHTNISTTDKYTPHKRKVTCLNIQTWDSDLKLHNIIKEHEDKNAGSNDQWWQKGNKTEKKAYETCISSTNARQCNSITMQLYSSCSRVDSKNMLKSSETSLHGIDTNTSSNDIVRSPKHCFLKTQQILNKKKAKSPQLPTPDSTLKTNHLTTKDLFTHPKLIQCHSPSCEYPWTLLR